MEREMMIWMLAVTALLALQQPSHHCGMVMPCRTGLRIQAIALVLERDVRFFIALTENHLMGAIAYSRQHDTERSHMTGPQHPRYGEDEPQDSVVE